MKKVILSILFFLTVTVVSAQVPQQISYQSVIRDGNNVVVASSQVGIKISLLKGTATGPAVYVETHNKTTNANGLVSLEIGTGTVLSGRFSSIDWANGPYLIQTETDPTGGTNYSIPAVIALNSVPYALYAANGTPGPKGDKGDPGAIGDKGDRGATGLTGPQGPIGLTGPAGAVGDKGDTGPAGSTGAAGANGVAGTDGKTVRNGTSNPVSGTGVDGDFYINTATNTLFGPKANGAWPSGVALVGPSGATGAQGSTGTAGAQGIQGPIGATGAAGPAPSGTGLVTVNNGSLQTPGALTGDVTTSGGGLATTIGAAKVTNSMLAGSIDLTSKVTGALPVANGGTGSSTKNFVDLSESQTISGTKTFNDYLTIASTTSSSSTTSGAFILGGGAGIGGNVNVGGTLAVTGASTFTGDVTSAGGSISGFDAALNDQTGTSYTLTSSDNGKVVTLDNASAITLTINTGLGNGFNCLIVQKNNGQITITGGTGVTLINRQNHNKTAGRFAVVSIVNIGSDTIIIAGDTGT